MNAEFELQVRLAALVAVNPKWDILWLLKLSEGDLEVGARQLAMESVYSLDICGGALRMLHEAWERYKGEGLV